MLKITIKDALEQNVDSTGHYLYVYRDGETVLYVGMSNSPLDRLKEHLGLTGRSSVSSLGRVIEDNLPASLNWTLELFTLADSASLLKQQLPDMTGYDATIVSLAEEEMIEHFQPCLNRMNATHYHNPLPERYRKHRIANNGVIISK